MQIKEPEVWWPIVLVAAVITALLGLLAAVLQYVAISHPPQSSYSAPRNTWERHKDEIVVGQVVGSERHNLIWRTNGRNT